MKKTMLNLIIATGLIAGTIALSGQKSSGLPAKNPIYVTEQTKGTGIEGTWKIYKMDGKIVENDLTKTFAAGGILISKQGRATKKTKWKMENGKLCINEVEDHFECCQYKVTKKMLVYTILGSELTFIRK